MPAGVTTALSGMIERLNPRERVLLGLMSFVAIGMVCFLVILLTNQSISSLEEEVQDRAMLLDQMRSSADRIRDGLESQSDEEEQGEEPENYTTTLLDHATKSGMAETDVTVTPEPDESVGSWIRSSVKVSVRQKPLGELSTFWALIASDRAKYPVAISKLNIRRRRNKEDAFDVEMIVSTYRINREAPPAKSKRGKRSSSKAGRKKSGK